VRNRFFVSAATLAIVVIPTVTSAQAASEGETSSNSEGETASQFDEIVVTATRQPTNVQDTPLAITAVTAETLATRGIQTASEVAQIVPNATFAKAQGAFGPGVTTYIRGIGSRDTSLAGEAAVAYYIDDVYYPLLLGSNFDLLDLDHVEILRGPQGTLFGRNALAGAVNLVSKSPDLNEASGYVEATIGAYQRRDFRAGVNLPLIEDVLGLSLSVLSKEREGYQKILDFRCQMEANGTPQLAGSLPYSDVLLARFSNNKPDDCQIGTLGGEEVRAIRGSLLWEPSVSVSLTITGDYIKDQSGNVADNLLDVNEVRAAARTNMATQAAYFGIAYDDRFVTGDAYSTYANYCDPIGAGVVIPGNAFYNGRPTRGGACFDPKIDLTNWGVSTKLVVDLGSDIDFTGIFGYREIDDTHAFDTDGSPLVQEHTLAQITESYYNVEARLSGRHEWIDWVAGAFLFRGEGRNRAVTYSPWNGFYKYQNTTYDPTSKAVFANVNLRPFDDRLKFVIGGRYSDDEKVVDYSNLQDDGLAPLEFEVAPQEARFDWRLGVNYDAWSDTMIYASVATGAQAPGFNGRPLQDTQIVQYPGDRTRAYEVGIKTDLLDRRLRINAVAFYTEYYQRITAQGGQEAQVNGQGGQVPGAQVVIPNDQIGQGVTGCRQQTAAEAAAGPGVQCIGRTFFVNTPGEAKGFEVELEARPVDDLLINASIGYAKFSSPDLDGPNRITDRLVAIGIGIPEWTASGGIQYEIEIPELAGSITPRLDVFYTGSVPFDATNTAFFQDPYAIVNTRLTYANDEYDFNLALGATNLFNQFYYRNYFIYDSIGFASTDGQPSPPREWYLKLTKNF
jgi:iron complex outermembrane receptor protein